MIAHFLVVIALLLLLPTQGQGPVMFLCWGSSDVLVVCFHYVYLTAGCSEDPVLQQSGSYVKQCKEM